LPFGDLSSIVFMTGSSSLLSRNIAQLSP